MLVLGDMYASGSWWNKNGLLACLLSTEVLKRILLLNIGNHLVGDDSM